MKLYETKVEFAHRPDTLSVTPLPNGNALVTFFDVVEAIPATEDTEARYLCNLYTLETINAPDLMERIIAAPDAWREKAVSAARAECAAEVRRTRNALLLTSDEHMTLDRCGLALPETITAATMLAAVKSLFEGLRSLINGDWAKYRQALRDVPQQSGFPFSVTWPTAPDAANHEED